MLQIEPSIKSLVASFLERGGDPSPQKSQPCDTSFIRGAAAALVWSVATIAVEIVRSGAVFMLRSLAGARGQRAVRPRAGDRSPRRSGAISIVGENFSASIATDAPASAGRRAHTGFRNNERMPLICPTCQLVLSGAGGRRLLCMGLFSIFLETQLLWPRDREATISPVRPHVRNLRCAC